MRHDTMTPLYAGIDLGTSGCRLIIIDDDKNIVTSDAIAYENPDKQTPELWWQSVCQLLENLPKKVKKNLASLAVDGTSGTILLTDAQGKPSSSVLMYHDLRGGKQAEKINTILDKNNGGQGASSSLARLLWLLENEPSPHHAHALHQADYILATLSNGFNTPISDENNCLKLGYDVINRCWPLDALKKLGIKSSLLPEVFPAGKSVATIEKKLAKRLGLSESLELVTGTTDSIAAFIATKADQVGDAVTSLGSTFVVKLLSDKPLFSPKHGIYSHRLKDMWLVGGASNSGAKVLLHYFSTLQLTQMTPYLSANASTGLQYYPLLKEGERFPIADAHKQPVLSPRPQSDIVFFQGMLEGIATIEMQAYNKLVELGAPAPASIRSVGGGSKNKAWTSIRNKMLKIDMITPQYTEAAYGSALLAKQGFTRL